MLTPVPREKHYIDGWGDSLFLRLQKNMNEKIHFPYFAYPVLLSNICPDNEKANNPKNGFKASAQPE